MHLGGGVMKLSKGKKRLPICFIYRKKKKTLNIKLCYLTFWITTNRKI